MTLDIARNRQDFPILSREVRPGVPLVYLDSAATAQKPVAVIAAMDDFYRHSNANIHRGIHVLAEEATALYEKGREQVANFIHAPAAKQIIFTRNTSESINMVAYTWGRANMKSGDVILLTEMEHHSNIVPWQMLAAERGVRLEFIPVTSDGLLDLDIFRKLLEQNPKLVSFAHMSNVLGTVTPAAEIIHLAHAAGALTVVDGAQSVPHIPVDVQALDVDFLAFSAHKMLGPTGIGALYGKASLLEAMPPFLGGGDMIKAVHLKSFTPNAIPHKFEAGTPAIAEAVGFGAAVAYLTGVGMKAVATPNRRLSLTHWKDWKRYPVCASWDPLLIKRVEWLHLVSRESTRMMLPKSWITTALPCAPAITAPSHYMKSMVYRLPRAPVSISTTPVRK